MNETARLAVVTGASRGLGAAIADRLAEDGWQVGRLDVAFEDNSDQGDPMRRITDVRDPAALEAATQELIAASGPLGAFVNNAGIARRGRIEDLAQADWQDTIDVNLTGVFNGMRVARNHMDRGGAIVSIASVAAFRGAAGRAPYTAAKAGVLGLTMAAAVEWAEAGIRVNAVSPGYAETDLVRSAVAEGVLPVDNILPRIPMRRMATPAEIGDAVAFLCSPRAGYVTGQSLAVDGGFLADYGVPLSDRDESDD